MARVQKFALRIALASALLAGASAPTFAVAAGLPDPFNVQLDLGRPHWDITGATIWDDKAGAGRWRPAPRAASKAAEETSREISELSVLDSGFQTIGFTPTGPSLTGKAAWYGAEFDGRLTASGERFDMYRLTAASDRLPLNSYASVSNRSTGETVVVRINDRRATPGGELIVLSLAAATRLGLDAAPDSTVELRELGDTAPGVTAPVQVATR